MKYKYEFEANDDYFVKGHCIECPLGYTVHNDDWNVHCVLNVHYSKCPLEEVEVKYEPFNKWR